MNGSHAGLHNRTSVSGENNSFKDGELITYIFPDFNAVDYFQRDFILNNEFYVLEEGTERGFDIYVVEQWVDKRHIGSVVSTFTGNLDTEIAVAKFTVMAKPVSQYPPKFQAYLNELYLSHAKIKKMNEDKEEPDSHTGVTQRSMQILYVTNISTLPSTLNLVPVPHGDVRDVKVPFIINFNLKKLRCTGRSVSLISEKVADVSEDKFRSLYFIFDPKIPLSFAVRELVGVVQTCLFYFDLLDPKFCDGLLCSKTEDAISNWWNYLGLPHFNFKPNMRSGIMQPTSVAAILSLALSSRIRLQLIGGYEVPKDILQFDYFMLAVGSFQKSYRLEKTRKLDTETLQKLCVLTNAKLFPDGKGSGGPDQSWRSHDYEENLNSLYTRAPAESSKKNRIYYGKELKKLTHVVKNTVQDHINAANLDSDDGRGGNSKSSSAKIRDKISKFADSLSPIDVETLDLLELVRNYLVGKSLISLWYGVPQSNVNGFNQKSSKKKPSSSHSSSHKHIQNNHHRHGHNNGHNHSHSHSHGHIHKHGHHYDHHFLDHSSTDGLYVFESLAEKVSNANDLVSKSQSIADLSRYSRGINKMKLQGKKFLANKKELNYSVVDLDEKIPKDNKDEQLESQAGQGIQYHPREVEESIYPHEVETHMKDGQRFLADDNLCQIANDPLKDFKRNIRRNSLSGFNGERSCCIGMVEFSRNGRGPPVGNFGLAPEEKLKLKRTSSFSAVESAVLRYDQFASVEKLSSQFLRAITQLVVNNNLKFRLNEEGSSAKYTNPDLEKSISHFNLTIARLNNHYKQIMKKKQSLTGDMARDLQFNITDLAKMVDRLAYESKIVFKRVNELEQSNKLFNLKFNEGCVAKLDYTISNVINSKKFKEVFKNVDERSEIIFKLTGESSDKYIHTDDDDDVMISKTHGIFQIILTFIFNLIEYFFAMLQFDRSRMNLNRIRKSWIKLDPNRTIINRAYSWVGKEPSRSSVARAKDEASLS